MTGRPSNQPEEIMLRCGIDLGGTKTEIAVLDRGMKTVYRERSPTPASQGYQSILQNIADMVHKAENALGGVPLPVGVGAPGAVSRKTGHLKNSNTQCLNGQPLHQDLAAILDRPVTLENDANCFALSEATDGAARGHRVVFGVIVGTGCGGSLLIDRKLHYGPNEIAGEWGHAVLDPSGPACYCGHTGCNEAYLSGPGLRNIYRNQTGKDAEGDSVAIVEAARQGNPLAAKTFDIYLTSFARALANLINTLDPDVIVLGGGMSMLPEVYDTAVPRVADYIFNDEVRTPIARNKHGDASGVRGAAMLAAPTPELA